MALLEIKNLSVGFDTSTGQFMAVQGIDLSVDAREVLAIVGESGSGKSVAMLAVMGLLPKTATVTADSMTFDGHDMLTMTTKQRREIVGRDVAMIFQEPMASLNPCFTVGFPAGGSPALPYEDGRNDTAQACYRIASSRWAFRRRKSVSTPTRTRCPAANASAS